MSVLGRAVKHWSNLVTHYYYLHMLPKHTHTQDSGTDNKKYLKFTLTVQII